MESLVRVAIAVSVTLAIGCPHPTPTPTPPPTQFAAINHAGELVDVEAAVVPGYVTVIDFRADWCGGCVVVEDRLRAAIANDPRVVVRTVDVGDGQSPVAVAYGIRGLPHVLVIDRRGNLRYRLVGNDAITVGDVARGLADEP
jgi:thiol-disulfide isomerase/thioredoxin